MNKEVVKFFKVFQKNRTLKINFILLCLIFLIFPYQNAYQSWQPENGRPRISDVDWQVNKSEILPVNKTGIAAPWVSAQAVIIIDLPGKNILYAKNPDQKLLPASTTKIMTALVAMDFFRDDDVLTVDKKYNTGQVIGLEVGEKISFQNLLYALLVGSGNDAAQILAYNYPGGERAFLEKMNQKAQEWHLVNTHFINVSGIDAYNHRTSARDLVFLSAIALQIPEFEEIVSTEKITVADISGEQKHILENTNKLLGQVTGVKGVKTGWTENAGECLVTYTDRQSGKILTVVLGSGDRFGESTKLINWVYDNFSWETIDTSYRLSPEHSQ